MTKSRLCASWSLGALLTFAWLARTVRRGCGSVVTPLATTFAIGIFAVSHYLVRYGSELKPYSCDLLAATVVLALAAVWLCDDARREAAADRWLWLLALVTAPLLLLSYPAVLVFGAAGLALAPRLVRRGPSGSWRASAALCGALLVGFAVSYGIVGRLQRAAANQGVGYLETFWAEAFPPTRPLAFLGWLVQTHTGLAFAYPNGGRNGGSTATTILFCVGAWVLARRRDAVPEERSICRSILLLLMMPLVVGVVAAALRLYPYGGHLRLTLYLAPSVCLLAGIGLERALRALPRESWRAVAPRVALVALLLAGIGDVVADVARPYRDRRHADMRHAMAEVASLAGGDGRVVSLPSLDEVRATDGLGSNYEWYLRTRAPGVVRWGGHVGGDDLRVGARIVVVAPSAGDGRDDPPALVAWRARHPELEAVDRRAYCLGARCSEALVVAVLHAPGRARIDGLHPSPSSIFAVDVSTAYRVVGTK
ncbi:MAG: hypothetical protein FJ148_16010 [Deltaproteobacteria bacterium]|nr:hypothetical protein [Deltaproteobacteria bacterium]